MTLEWRLFSILETAETNKISSELMDYGFSYVD